MVGYGMPRVGNQAFANLVDKMLSGKVVHINNKEDPITVIPTIPMGFHHPSGEIHIQDSGEWDVCPGVFPTPLHFVCLCHHKALT
ncbi:hypothetical protein BJV78DRAFT_1225185, partial [Lactifluus subvellereus]